MKRRRQLCSFPSWLSYRTKYGGETHTSAVLSKGMVGSKWIGMATKYKTRFWGMSPLWWWTRTMVMMKSTMYKKKGITRYKCALFYYLYSMSPVKTSNSLWPVEIAQWRRSAPLFSTMRSPLISVVFPLGFYNLGGRIWGRRWWRLQEVLEILWGTCRISESLGDSLQRQNGEVHRSLATPWKWRFAMCNRDGHLLSKWKLESKKYLGIHSLRYICIAWRG